MSDSDIELLTRMRDRIVEAECRGDLSVFAELFDEDAVVMPPDAPAHQGKVACLLFMRDVLGSLLAQFDRELSCDSAEIVINGSLAFDRGTFSQTLQEKDGGLVVRERGHYLWLYARRGVEWKLARVIWNGGEEVQDLPFEPGDSGEESFQ